MVWAPDYVAESDLAAFLRINDSDDDVQLGFAVSAASRAVDNATNRQFGQVDTAEERVYTAEWDRRRCRWIIEFDDLMDDTGLTVTTDDGEIDSYTLEPVNATQKGKPWRRLVVDTDSSVKPSHSHLKPSEPPTATVEALWGWDAIPDAVKQATLLQASRFHFRRFSPAGVAGSPETGSEVRLLARVDPDVKVALTDYVRWWGAA